MFSFIYGYSSDFACQNPYTLLQRKGQYILIGSLHSDVCKQNIISVLNLIFNIAALSQNIDWTLI